MRIWDDDSLPPVGFCSFAMSPMHTPLSHADMWPWLLLFTYDDNQFPLSLILLLFFVQRDGPAYVCSYLDAAAIYDYRDAADGSEQTPCVIFSSSSICLLASSFKFSFYSADDMDSYESIYGVHMHTPQPLNSIVAICYRNPETKYRHHSEVCWLCNLIGKHRFWWLAGLAWRASPPAIN